MISGPDNSPTWPPFTKSLSAPVFRPRRCPVSSAVRTSSHPHSPQGNAGGRTPGLHTERDSKSLRTLRTGKLIVTVPDIANPFFSLILKGIEDAAQREGYNVLVGDTQHEEEREERYAEMLKRKEADGLIFLGHRLPKEAASLMKSVAPRCAPVVNGCEFSPRLGIPSVHIDNAKAAARGNGASLQPRPSPHRHRHRSAGEPVEPRSPRGRDRAGAKSRARSAISS